ncbi:MAG TPA: phosphoglucosamine mutase [Candidatus Dormibacteraeota bacterium]|jgi:phosphoglucosamine mutase|nr:phosphoglucosamine mutase [Candidatus Dormibacteraeota bacterium]
MARLFGTDGVRGVANMDLTPELALALGRAAGAVLCRYVGEAETPAQGGVGQGVIVGRDTRRSGRMLESALAAGLCSVGMEVWLAGVIPTPGLAFLATLPEFVAGAVISASHNPAPDNGIKFFDGDGLKLADATEEEIEGLMDASRNGARPAQRANVLPRPTEAGIGRVGDRRDLVDVYVGRLLSYAPSLAGMRIVLDCANGATFRVAPKLFRAAGADLRVLFDSPDGTNINAGCGSTDPRALQRAVVEQRAAIGFAFDGDGDRVIVVDERGALVDGDALIGILALEMRRRSELSGDVVVGTVTTNGGLEATLAREGVRLVRTPVGDKHVFDGIVKSGASLGGETSGHVIIRRLSTTGDGILTALRLLAVVRERGVPVSELARTIEIWPQILRNVHAPRREEWERIEPFASAVAAMRTRLGEGGSVIVRPSGTEPVLRIYVEARDKAVAASSADELARAAERLLS